MATKSTGANGDDRFVRFLEGIRLNRGIPLRDQVYSLVRKAIVIGKIAPGAAINEVDIAARLGISRTPVREAVKRVSDEGLVEVFAQNGTFVTDISRSQVEQAYIIRIALELESIKRAASVITTEQIQDLEDIINAQEIAVRRERFDEAIERDDDFHRGIALINDLDMVWKVVDISKAQMDRCRLLSLPSPGAGLETIQQHRTILEALSRHQEVESMAALRTHLETSMKNTFVYLDSRMDEPQA